MAAFSIRKGYLADFTEANTEILKWFCLGSKQTRKDTLKPTKGPLLSFIPHGVLSF